MIERTWSAIVDSVDAMGGWRPIRYVQVGGYGFIAGAASSPFVEPTAGGALVVATWFVSAAAYRVADVVRAQNAPSARAARAGAAARERLEGIQAAYRAENAARAAQQAAARRERRAEHTEWEWAALVADGGVLQAPARQDNFGYMTLNDRLLRTYQGTEFRSWGYGGAAYPQQSYPPGNNTPRCWCERYGDGNPHHWFTHTRPRT